MWGFVARNRFLMLVTLAALGLDQITKFIVIRTVDFGTSWPETGFFRITHVGNTGSAFGLLGGQNSLLIIASFVGMGVVVYFYRSHPNPGSVVRASLGLMLAGAMGNLIDRLVNGHVTDFIDIGPWWIFNVADASIVTGIAALAASVLLVGAPKPAPEADEATPASVAAGPSEPDAELAHDRDVEV